MHRSLNVFHQPKPFYMIFSLEFWERFGYAGVQAILAIYFVRQLGYTEAEADIVFGSFFALTFGLISIGGKLGDVYLGTKRVMLLGAITLAIGYFILGLAKNFPAISFLGMAAIAVGNGLFKANPSSLLSRCYEEGDPRLDGAFTMYYMAINLGAVFAMFLIPYLAHKYNWQLGFYVCTFGLLLCILTYLMMKSSVHHTGSKPDLQPLAIKKLITCIIGIIGAILICTWLLKHVLITQCILYIVGTTVLALYVLELLKLTGIKRLKMIVALILIIESVLFFVLYAQMPTSLNFFALRNVEHTLFGFNIVPESFQVLNPAWVVIGSPILATIYNHLGRKGLDLSMPTKFAVGMVLCASGFLILPFAATTANEQGIISSNWIILSYGLQSIGELFVSALGLAMIAQLVPKYLSGFIMGAWFLGTSFAAIIAGHVASLTAPPPGVTDPIQTLPIYSHMFLNIGTFTAIAAALMLITAPYLTRLIRQ